VAAGAGRRQGRGGGNIGAGLPPVGENDRHDHRPRHRLARLAEGKSCDTPMREVMTTDAQYCFEDEELPDAAAKMGALQLRRLPALDHDKRLGGIARIEGESAKAALGRATGSGAERRQN